MSPGRPEADEARSGEELDPASYEHWRAEGYRGRPPWRRGYRWGYFAISLALVVLIAGLLWLLVHST